MNFKMKSLKLLKLYFERTFVFRFNFLMLWATNIVRFLFTVLLWKATLKNVDSTFAYSENSMIIYFLVIMIIGLCIQTDVAERVSSSIYNGNLSVDLLKPISLHMLNFVQGLASKIIFLCVLVFIAVVLFFIPQYSSLFCISVVLSLIINFELYYIIGLIGFWTYTVWGIAMVNDVLINIFGGRMFPLEIAGSTFKTISAMLPYQYIYYIPTQVLEGKQGFFALLVQSVYIAILFALSKIIFKCGLKHYEAAGM